LKTGSVVVGLVAAAFLCTSHAGADGVVSATEAGLLSVRAEATPVGRVLRELLPLIPMDGLWVDPKVEAQPVTLELAGVTPSEALNGVLMESRLPFLVWGGTKGPWRVVVGDKSAALRVGGSDVAASPPDGEAAPDRPRDALIAQWQEHEAEMDVKAAADFEAASRPVEVTSDPGVPGGYTLVGDNLTFHDPTFVPYKSRPEVRARRQAIDVTTIP